MSKQIEFRVRPQGKVLGQYYRDRSRCSFIMGPLGSGKTYQTFLKLLDLMCEQEPNSLGIRPTRWFVVRNTYSDLTATTIRDFLEVFEEGSMGRMTYGPPPEFKAFFHLDDGTSVKSEIIFIGLDKPDSIRKLKSSQVTGLVLAEAKELPWGAIQMCDLRHGRYPSMVAGGVKPTWRGMIGDTNAPDEDEWYHRLAEGEQNPKWKFFKQPGGVIKVDGKWTENPNAENLKNLAEDYYQDGLLNKSEDWIKVMLANEYGFVLDGKAVYPEYSETLHNGDFTRPIGGAVIYRGWDFGLTPACSFSQLLPGQFRVFDELVSVDTSVSSFADMVLDHCAKYQGFEFVDYADPAGNNRNEQEAKTSYGILQGKGIMVEPGEQSQMMRKESVKFALNRLEDGKPFFQIGPQCRVLRKALKGGYKYRRLQVSGEKYSDHPDKNDYSHVMESLEYTATRLFGERVRGQDKPSEEFKMPDMGLA